MDSIDYYNDKKYCPKCDKYVTYLQSIQACYCTQCGGQVRLFSKADWEEFQRQERGAAQRAKRMGFGGSKAREAGESSDSPARRHGHGT